MLNIPDFIANAGGLICGSVERRGGDGTRAFAAISERIGANTVELLDRMAATGESPRAAAESMARTRLDTAGAYHRHF